MSYYNKDLYHHIIERFAGFATDLKIITGYGSYSMAEHILKKYPHLNITLYIGMTLSDGILKEDHNNFIRLVNQYNSRFNVYYQIAHPSTHIKLYTWMSNGEIITNIVGSANFTDNGLFKLNELMVESMTDYSELFAFQDSNSLSCTNSDVYDIINIYEETLDETKNDIELTSIVNDMTQRYQLTSTHNERSSNDESTQNNHMFFKYRNLLRSSVSSTNKIKIPVILKNVGNSNTRGINQRFRGSQQGYLMKSIRYPFKDFFPMNTALTFYTDDDKTLRGIVYESQIDNLYFEDDIYDYFFNRLSLSNIRPIDQLDLKNYGRDSVTIIKLNETEYLFDFNHYT